MKALKALVIIMGIMLVVGICVLVWGMTGRGGSNPASAPVNKPHLVPAAVVGPDFGQVNVPIPAGAKILQVLTLEGRLVLRVQAQSGAEHMVVLDPVSGHVAGEFVLDAAHP